MCRDITGMEETTYQPLNELQVRQSFLGAAFVMLLYVAHLFWASSATEFVTVSASHLLAPTLFGIAGYVRMSEHNFQEGLTSAFFNGHLWEVLLVAGGIQALTWLLARNRMRVYLRKFEGELWEIEANARADRSYLKLLAARIQPLFLSAASFFVPVVRGFWWRDTVILCRFRSLRSKACFR